MYRSLLQCNGTKASCFSKDQATAGSINSGRYISPNWAKRLGEQQQGPICPHVDHMATMYLELKRASRSVVGEAH